jgi:taurine--2-oxoglutarate transaminase
LRGHHQQRNLTEAQLHIKDKRKLTMANQEQVTLETITGEQVIEYDLAYNLRPWAVQKGQTPIAVSRADGIFLWDYDGRKYFDMSSQLVNSNPGHNNAELNAAIIKQLSRFAYLAPAHALAPRSLLAKSLVELAPGDMAKVFFTCGGGESNDNAVLIARAVTGRTKIFSAYRSYHGSTHGAGNLSGDNRRFAAEKPATPGYIKFFAPYPYRDITGITDENQLSEYYLKTLREQILFEGSENIAAITLEAIPGTSGVIVYPKSYLRGVRRICDEFGILLHLDEIMTGFYRTGKAFAFENFEITADIITFAKGVTCGYVPLGGVIVNRRIADFYDTHPLLCGLTYNGHPLGCAAGIATLDYYNKNRIGANVLARGAFLKSALEDLKARHNCVGDVRGAGLFYAVELVKDKATREPLTSGGSVLDSLNSIIGLLRERGFLTIGRSNNIIIAPPLIITDEQLAEALEILDDVLTIADKPERAGQAAKEGASH